MPRALVFCLTFAFLAAIAYGQVTSGPRKLTVAEAIDFVDAPSVNGNFSIGSLHVYYAMQGLFSYHTYRFEPNHAAAWKAALQNKKYDDCTRICATYFLLDKDEEARAFIQEQLASKDLRVRYNAAELLRFRVGAEKAQDWEIDLLITALKEGSLDGSRSREPRQVNIEDGFVPTPIDDVCRTFGHSQVKRAVPALISVMERQLPGTEGAAIALGDLQDPRAIPILMKTLERNSDTVGGEVLALAKFKHRPAVPILVSRLGKVESTVFGDGNDALLNALLKFKDPSAAPGIEAFMKTTKGQKHRAIAKRVLVQLTNADPVPELLVLLDEETDNFERCDLIQDLADFGGTKVRERLQAVATQSNSFDQRRQAIFGLGKIGDQQSLLFLASLLEHKLPKDVKGGWKVANHQQEFDDTIEEVLREKTRRNFGRDRAKWEQWIRENVKS